MSQRQAEDLPIGSFFIAGRTATRPEPHSFWFADHVIDNGQSQTIAVWDEHFDPDDWEEYEVMISAIDNRFDFRRVTAGSPMHDLCCAWLMRFHLSGEQVLDLAKGG